MLTSRDERFVLLTSSVERLKLPLTLSVERLRLFEKSKVEFKLKLAVKSTLIRFVLLDKSTVVNAGLPITIKFSKAVKSSIPVKFDGLYEPEFIVKVVTVLILLVKTCPSKVVSKPKSIKRCSKWLSGIAVVWAFKLNAVIKRVAISSSFFIAVIV